MNTIYAVVAIYLFGGVAFVSSLVILQKEVGDLVSRAMRLVPGFQDAFLKQSTGATMVGSFLRTFFGWPYAAIDMLLLRARVRSAEKSEDDRLRGSLGLPSNIPFAGTDGRIFSDATRDEIEKLVNEVMYLGTKDEQIFDRFVFASSDALKPLGLPNFFHQKPVSMLFVHAGTNWLFRCGKKRVVDTMGNHGDLIHIVRLDVTRATGDNAWCEFHFWNGCDVAQHGHHSEAGNDKPQWMTDDGISVMSSADATEEFRLTVKTTVIAIKHALEAENAKARG